jgi:hypothetical protein
MSTAKRVIEEQLIADRVKVLVGDICEVLGDESDGAIILATISELFAIYLSTMPADSREPILLRALDLTRERLKRVRP